MRHVDDGTLHAWLDHQVTDRLEVAWIEEHLRECGACAARLAEERATLERADSLLGAIAPIADAGRPSFEALVAKARESAAGSSKGDTRSTFSAWLVPASWAASVALAVALGWAVRDLIPTTPTSNGSQETATPSSVQPAQPQSSTPTPVVPGETPARAAPQRRANSRTAGAAPSQRSQPRPAEGAVAPATPNALEIAPAPPPVVEPPPSAPAPAPAPPAARAADDAVSVAVVPSAAAPGGGGGGGRGGGRGGGGGRAAGVAGGQPGGVAVGRGAGFGTGNGTGAAPSQSLVIDGMVVSGANVPLLRAADGTMWQPIQRSDAAARTGMALYGLEGMTPELTTINAEGTAVRTVYRLPTDGVLEVIQQLREDRRDARVNVVAEAPVVDVQNARVQQAQGAAQPSAPAASQGRIAVPPVDAVQGGISPPPWSTVRGDVLLTLRGVADAAALASRLRRD